MQNLATYFSVCIFSALVFSGCGAGAVAMPPRSVYVSSLPPSPLAETTSQAPAPLMVRVDGYWFWREGRYVWIPGHWESPQSGKHWQVPSLQPAANGHGWVYEQGRWQDD